MASFDVSGKKLLILGATGTEMEIVRQAQDMGVFVVVTDYLDDTERNPVKRAADEVWDISWNDTEALAEKCRAFGIDGVIAGFSEQRVVAADHLCKKLGLPFYTQGADLKTIFDKKQFKEACRRVGVDVPRKFDPSDSVEYPVIVKPLGMGGSRGVSVCTGPDDLSKALEVAREESPTAGVLVEEFLVADEIYLYYIVHDGSAKLAAAADLLEERGTSGSLQVPIATRFPSHYLPLILHKHDDRFKKLIASLGIQNGLIGFQALVDGDRVMPYDPTFRLDMTSTHRYTSAINGLNGLEMLIRYSLTGSMGVALEIDGLLNPEFPGIALTIVVLLKKGRISSIRGEDIVRQMDGVLSMQRLLNVGDELQKGPSYGSGIYLLQLIAQDEQDLERLLKDIYDSIIVLDEDGRNMVYYPDLHRVATNGYLLGSFSNNDICRQP